MLPCPQLNFQWLFFLICVQWIRKQSYCTYILHTVSSGNRCNFRQVFLESARSTPFVDIHVLIRIISVQSIQQPLHNFYLFCCLTIFLLFDGMCLQCWCHSGGGGVRWMQGWMWWIGGRGGCGLAEGNDITAPIRTTMVHSVHKYVTMYLATVCMCTMNMDGESGTM